MINTPTGIVDLRTGSVKAHDPGLLVVQQRPAPDRHGVMSWPSRKGQAVKLVKQIEGKAGQGAGDTKSALGRSYPSAPSTAGGIVIDGVVTPLQGKPPVAVSHGWGDLTSLYRPRG